MDPITVDIIERAKLRQKMLMAKYAKENEETEDVTAEVIETEKERVSVTKVVSESNSVKERNTVKEISCDISNTKKNCTRVSSDLQSSPETPTKTLNIQQENFNMEIKLTSTDNVRLEVEIEEREETDGEDNNADKINVGGFKKIIHQDNENVMRADVKNRLQRLGKLYSGVDEIPLSSPIHRTESKFYEDVFHDDVKKSTKITGLGKLKALADTMNQWEDEVTPQKVSPKKTTKPPAPKPPLTFTHSPMKGPAPKPPVSNGSASPTVNAKIIAKIATTDDVAEKKKYLSPRKTPENNLDKKDSTLSNEMLATLEAQGFKRTNSNSRIIYNYANENISEDSDDETETNKCLASQKDTNLEEIEEEDEECESKISIIASKFSNKSNKDNKATEQSNIKADQKKSETEDTQKQSKFSQITSKFSNQKQTPKEKTEDNKSTVLSSPSKSNYRSGGVLQKASIFEQSPTKTKDPALMTVSERKALFEKNKGIALIPKTAFAMAAPIKHNMDKENVNKPVLQPKTATGREVKPNLSTSPQKLNGGASQNTNKAGTPQTTNDVKETKTIFSPKKAASSSKPNVSNVSPTKAFIAESGGIASKMKALLERKTTISQSQITNSIQEQRQKEMDMLLNRFHKHKDIIPEENDTSSDEENVSEITKMISEKAPKIVNYREKDMELLPPPSAPPKGLSPQKSAPPKRRSKGDSPKVREVLQEVKRIRVSPPKSGRMYPCLSDIEASTTETDQEMTTAAASPDSSYEENSSYAESDEPNTSFGREILKAVCNNQSPKQKRPIFDESTASDISDILDDEDDCLDEALAYIDSDNMEGPTPPKQGRAVSPKNAAPSHSFHYSKGSLAAPSSPVRIPNSPAKLSQPTAPPAQIYDEGLPTHVLDGDSVLPLTHTVSFYRKQQAQGSQTPIRKITRPATVVEESPEKENEKDQRREVLQKIQELMNVVSKQQTVISQASQALNLCCSTIEFSGSSEQVEAERLLLVASHRRQAALHEIQRLKVEGTLQPGGGPLGDKATLKISNITLPLKKEYVRALSAAGGQGHHLVCLIRCAEQVMPTKLASTVASPRDDPQMTLHIPDSVVLENLYANFTVTVEVYSVQAQEELLPHEVKYHIFTKKSGSKLTPKKKQDSRLVMPCVQSPAGPQAVRSSSFALLGYVVFSMQAINRAHWTLNNTPALSPLDGSLQMTVNCELAVSVEQRGFLTMFEDVSGFGAWHRRWCVLKGNCVSYWKYPDDEKKKPSIDSINLLMCSTEHVGPVSRDICARPHTFLLEAVRPALPGDKDSLVTVCKGNQTIIRHLLSADTKEERIEWCDKFNKALEVMRLWGKKAKK